MKIAKAFPSDHRILSDITFKGKTYWNYDAAQMQNWKPELTIASEYIEAHETYKLIVEEEIVGYYSFVETDKNTIKLDNLFLLPKCIGLGYGKFLMNDFLKRATKTSATKIILDADPNAENFYKTFGFQTYNKLETSIKGRFLPQMELDIMPS
ncbi:hypothetical protein FNO01nite_18060 [Flavobacterium noncentrifugens]|uniref:Acetyltransferase (GNAT) domain-containing protein n=1 Tax=Flavobacterium noncentrifugens TaxID=1128970 RepID=A0A1G8Y980_9FLAO|nr:GNAT family N-acetyltransferase [Flavobacterium noncentrifugens]GEP51134.1 hypothetical protein FNO01nite_18060 [Flavobacterium noncentrifugens]SDJ99281.1 Acetyltransferase (GNAT) domain-containing protein [Flavobacterium noncentrifugens]